MWLFAEEMRLEPNFMPADPTLQPGPSDVELQCLRKITQIASGLAPADPSLNYFPGDVELQCLRKINQLLWNLLDEGGGAGPTVGPWIAAAFDPGWSGTLMGRWLGDPIAGMVQLKGNFSGTPWDTSFSPVVFTLDPSLRPIATRYVIFPSGSGSMPNTISAAIITNGGAALVGVIGTGTPAQAWLDGVVYSLN
jgi:hypothetical protein